MKSIEDVPLFSTSLRIMKFWSFIIVHNWRRYFVLTPYIIINTSQFLDIYFSEESIDAIIRNTYITVLFFNSIVRATLLCINSKRYEKFMDELRQVYIEIMESPDMLLRRMLNETTQQSRTFAKINFIMGTVSSIGFIIYPIFVTTRVLPFGMFVPGIDKHASPFYEIFFVVQVLITPMGCCMYIPYSNLIVSFIMFGILMCKVLQNKLRKLRYLESHEVRPQIISCIKYQLQLLREESIDAIIRNTYITVLFFNSIVRTVLLCINSKRYEKFMDELRQLYIELMQSPDMLLRRMLNETTQQSRTLAKINLIMGIGTCIGFSIYPIFATTRVLPFGMFIPGIDKYASPFYEIFFVIQVIMTPMGCSMYIPFTNLIVAFIMFAILMCKVLQNKLRQLRILELHEVRLQVIWCIKYQMHLLRYIDVINSLTTYIFLVEFVAFGAMLCAMLFLFLIVETVGQMVIVTAYIIMIFAQIVVMYYFANELYDQSLAVAIAAYDSNWIEFDVKTEKLMQLLILRSQKPCAIMIGNVYPMNLERLQSLLNATYTYFTLLRRVYG